HLKEVRGAEILILFVEVSSGSYKVSLRSKGSQDVHTLATRFGGGGHAKASGFRLQGSLEDVVAQVVEAACQTLMDE
ncbi:MAG: DHHA1 domain-containing protein, partial [Planctomycetota bacterium]